MVTQLANMRPSNHSHSSKSPEGNALSNSIFSHVGDEVTICKKNGSFPLVLLCTVGLIKDVVLYEQSSLERFCFKLVFYLKEQFDIFLSAYLLALSKKEKGACQTILIGSFAQSLAYEDIEERCSENRWN